MMDRAGYRQFCPHGQSTESILHPKITKKLQYVKIFKTPELFFVVYL